MVALSLKRPEAAEFLLHHQVDPNQSGTGSSFPIIESCIESFDTVTTLLVSKGANVNVQDNRGRTALMEAVERRNRPIVELLLQHGANPYLRDKQDIDAILIAQSKGYDLILDMLRKPTAQSGL
jgi:ankyrin repeat protein